MTLVRSSRWGVAVGAQYALDGWMNGWMGRWVYGFMGGWINGELVGKLMGQDTKSLYAWETDAYMDKHYLVTAFVIGAAE
jgi:hypothetical protein